MTTTDETPWLGEDQQRVWRQWLAVTAALPAALNRQLQADSGLSLPDFDVLVQLSDHPQGRVRVSALADALQWERSRLSHHVKRMQARGLVEREECDDDGRGWFVVLTPRGRAVIAAAAPDHAREVRELVFDDLTPDELATLAGVTTKVMRRLTGRLG
ncbi:DNA-binding transcriptional regulator, MarR family [Nocardioides scoriae]|uniref:DNA-binding transcriptional regulator, MarR family n=1 Tax=Nocardioides scoriae TaxID=642780 RepID=A0A1H1VPL6_9ACTN|nr:MarR family transcriptional regulator [Nocardioides scoriae]SDS86817.1 DNA-binding transcriptional regulator, MarR family [Nocardioides scoriae]